MTDFVTSVPQPFYGPNGIVVPAENAILTGVQADVNTALGGNVNPQLTTPQGQISTTETAIIGDSNAQLLWFVNQVDPATSQGRMHDGIGRIYFLDRIAAQPTVQPCSCAGLNTTPIGIAAQAQDPATGLIWLCTQAGTIGSSGVVTLNFACATSGPIAAPASLVIYQQIYGWESIVPDGDAVLGNNVETDAQYEARRRSSVALNANQILDAIQGQVLQLPGVLDAYCYDNATSLTMIVGGVALGPNSIYICVLGGVQTAIAQAIYSKKGPGCAYNGNTATTVTDPSPAYNPPAPQYTVRYQTPTVVAFVVLVVLNNNPGIPSNALSLIQQAIINAFNGLDGGQRAKIGSRVFASRYYGGIAALGSWAQIVDIQLGVLAGAATFTGSITGTALTVNSVLNGALAPGQILQDAGVLASGTTIISGSGSNWVVSVSQNVALETMYATNLVNDVLMNISQAPAVSASNINLILM